VLAACPDVDEIVVVSDGSTDRTHEIAAAHPGVLALKLDTNVGKGGAMVAARAGHGRRRDRPSLDADLVGLQPRHVEALVLPWRPARPTSPSGSSAKAASSRRSPRSSTPQISGQRACQRETFLAVPHLTEAGLRRGDALTQYAARPRVCVR